MTTKTYSQLTRAAEILSSIPRDELGVMLDSAASELGEPINTWEIVRGSQYDVDRADAAALLASAYARTVMAGAAYLSQVGLNPHEILAEALRQEEAGGDVSLKAIVARQLGYIKRAGKNLDQQIERAQAQREKREARELQTDLELPEPASMAAPPPKRRGFFGALVGVFR